MDEKRKDERERGRTIEDLRIQYWQQRRKFSSSNLGPDRTSHRAISIRVEPKSLTQLTVLNKTPSPTSNKAQHKLASRAPSPGPVTLVSLVTGVLGSYQSLA